jgi:Tfp pilus assembly protein PilF
MTLGIYYQYVGDLNRSMAELDKAVSLNPNDADVLINAAWLCRDSANPSGRQNWRI